MSGITVIVVPTWAVWMFIAFGAVNIAQSIYKIVLMRRQERAMKETP